MHTPAHNSRARRLKTQAAVWSEDAAGSRCYRRAVDRIALCAERASRIVRESLRQFK